MTAWEGPEEKEGCVDWLTRIRVSGGGLSKRVRCPEKGDET
jgi:hypothetical protein